MEQIYTADNGAETAKRSNTHGKTVVSLKGMHFKEANELLREAIESVDTINLQDVSAQRYLGCAMSAGKRLEIHGTPGNDMACYMDGGEIEVYGNAQDQVGNTMNSGRVIVHGRCGDAAGYAMRSGRIIVRDGCGWRCGIHMKQYHDKLPAIVIGGDAGAFLGEYMAGGVIVLMGHAGEHLACGMHGGVIYLRHPLEDWQISDSLIQEPIQDEDRNLLGALLDEYNELFSGETDSSVSLDDTWYRLLPESSRPYGNLYI